jgi:hypothetical protein
MAWWRMPHLRLLAVFVVLAACDNSDDSGAFLPLDQVCVAYAEEICAAQQHCCEPPGDQVTCEQRVYTACEPQRDRLTMEDGLHYDGEHGSDQRDALGASLEDCSEPAPVAAFFVGGAAEGAACQRDAQCLSFVCSAEKCGPPHPQPLCDF